MRILRSSEMDKTPLRRIVRVVFRDQVVSTGFANTWFAFAAGWGWLCPMRRSLCGLSIVWRNMVDFPQASAKILKLLYEGIA